MSFEGFYQAWCPKGHESQYDVYDVSDCENEPCSFCGALRVATNLVDQTNGPSEGFFLSRYPLNAPPTKADLDRAQKCALRITDSGVTEYVIGSKVLASRYPNGNFFWHK